ncbi:hypothetical protein ERJ75_000663000 [Trypanosoma vivax]|nr:hypothetical protein ERJ75_000663000 [Trypanosoma vivax]
MWRGRWEKGRRHALFGQRGCSALCGRIGGRVRGCCGRGEERGDIGEHGEVGVLSFRRAEERRHARASAGVGRSHGGYQRARRGCCSVALGQAASRGATNAHGGAKQAILSALSRHVENKINAQARLVQQEIAKMDAAARVLTLKLARAQGKLTVSFRHSVRTSRREREEAPQRHA